MELGGNRVECGGFHLDGEYTVLAELVVVNLIVVEAVCRGYCRTFTGRFRLRIGDGLRAGCSRQSARS